MPTLQEFECSYSPVEDPILRIIGKYQNHPVIKLIKYKNKSQTFKFRDTNIDKIKESIENLDPKKRSQKSDMNTNIISKNAAFFKKYMCDDINFNKLKETGIVPVHKRSQNYLKKTIDLLVFFQISPRFMKNVYMIKCQNFLIIFFQSITVVFKRVTARYTAF